MPPTCCGSASLRTTPAANAPTSTTSPSSTPPRSKRSCAARKGDTVKLSGVGSQNVWHTDAGDRRENISLVARTVVDHTPTARNAATQQTTARTVAAEAGR